MLVYNYVLLLAIFISMLPLDIVYFFDPNVHLTLLTERFKDTIERIKWLSDEDFIISRCMYHLNLRKERVGTMAARLLRTKL